jgi:hypothetical protein
VRVAFWMHFSYGLVNRQKARKEAQKYQTVIEIVILDIKLVELGFSTFVGDSKTL